MSEWKEYKLDELGKIGRGKSKHRPRNDASLYGGIHPFIQTGDVKEAEFYITKYSQTYSELGLAQSKKWKKGTLCITIAANIAETGILGLDACFPDSIIGFIPFEDKSDVRYIKYSFDLIKKHLQSISQGTTQDNLSQDKLLKFYFKAPDVKEQHRIASILSAYDVLIENNNRRIAILEQMAEQIYKEWFVRMRFPGYENTEFEKGVPKGWEVTCYSELVEFKKGRNITADTVIQGSVPVVAGGLEPAYYHNTANTNSPTITISASGANAGYVNLYYDNIWASDCSFLDSKTTKCIFYHYLHLKTRQTEVYFLQKGSAQPHVYPKDLMSMKILKPQIDLIEKFNGLITPFFKEIKTLKTQSQNLKQTRDLLLPRLISGKLKVNELKEFELV